MLLFYSLSNDTNNLCVFLKDCKELPWSMICQGQDLTVQLLSTRLHVLRQIAVFQAHGGRRPACTLCSLHGALKSNSKNNPEVHYQFVIRVASSSSRSSKRHDDVRFVSSSCWSHASQTVEVGSWQRV